MIFNADVISENKTFRKISSKSRLATDPRRQTCQPIAGKSVERLHARIAAISQMTWLIADRLRLRRRRPRVYVPNNNSERKKCASPRGSAGEISRKFYGFLCENVSMKNLYHI